MGTGTGMGVGQGGAGGGGRAANAPPSPRLWLSRSGVISGCRCFTVHQLPALLHHQMRSHAMNVGQKLHVVCFAISSSGSESKNCSER